MCKIADFHNIILCTVQRASKAGGPNKKAEDIDIDEVLNLPNSHNKCAGQ
jgi:hypothetical protein